MLSITFSTNEKDFEPIIKILNRYGFYQSDQNGFELEIIKNNHNQIILEKNKEKGKITVSKTNQVASALSSWVNMAKKTQVFCVTETPQFEELGVMIDCSRNAVPTVAKLKEWIEHLALLGYTQLMLYTEDTYEVTSLPYFGHFRGRYTQAEIKELDAYAQIFGIELIPCIQTLAHLENALKWFTMRNLRDTEDILLVGHDETYVFLEKLIATIAENFTSKRIHIGMDEANMLGLGQYLNRNGYQDRFTIMNYHLQKVMSLLDKYELKPMMWSDMFFRLGSKTGDYYDLDTQIPQDMITQIPEVEMVYWDYYHDEQSDYETLIARHFDLQKPVIFAGATWTFNGMVPNYSKSFITTDAALNACKKCGVKEVFCTLWLDDGAETILETAYPGLAYFAAHHRTDTLDQQRMKEEFQQIFKIEFDTLYQLNRFDTVPTVEVNNKFATHPAKFSLWQDPLLGLYDGNIQRIQLNQHYLSLYQDLAKVKLDANHLFYDSLQFYRQLAKVLSSKADLGKELYSAYQQKDFSKMVQLSRLIQDLIQATETLRLYHQKAWFKANKPFGWEVLDIRYGGLIARLKSSYQRIQLWLLTLEPIAELEEERLINTPQTALDQGNLGRNLYQHIVSTSKLSNV
ncbi:MAG TPA: beta-N-acetylhexosaminidase [Erysipelothrix sp.]